MPGFNLQKGTVRDTGALVVDMEVFGLVGELEVRKALRLQYPVAIVVVKPGLSPEEDGARLLERLARLISPLLRQTDLLAVSASPPVVYVLLIDVLAGDLEIVMTRISDEVDRHQLAGSPDSARLQINLGGGCFPSTATTWRDLVSLSERGTTAPA